MHVTWRNSGWSMQCKYLNLKLNLKFAFSNLQVSFDPCYNNWRFEFGMNSFCIQVHNSVLDFQSYISLIYERNWLDLHKGEFINSSDWNQKTYVIK